MTDLLVRVADASEAAQAATAGIDIVELVSDDGAANLDETRAVRAAFPGCLRLRDTGGMTSLAATVERAIAVGANEIAFAPDIAPPAVAAMDLPEQIRAIAVLTATKLDAVALRTAGYRAVMLDIGDRTRLIDHAPIATLDSFAGLCRTQGLAFGLAGGLEAPDIARLLLLDPDVLAFDMAVRRGHDPAAALDVAALDAIRALVPRGGASQRKPAASISKVTDRIFVRDFETSLAIGAYQAEHDKRQRVRFSVVADVARAPVPPRDMRDVFSYDVIIEMIRVLSQRAHVTFVETLAEELAASLLTQDDVVAVSVKVEKLDVIAGSVGIEISRRRDRR